MRRLQGLVLVTVAGLVYLTMAWRAGEVPSPAANAVAIVTLLAGLMLLGSAARGEG